MTKKLIANLKMNMQIEDVKGYIKKVENFCYGNVDIIICPSYVHIPFFANKQFSLGSQNVSVHTKGAYTSEVSASQLKELGVKYSIIGHSECRAHFNETNDIINTKIKNCFIDRIIPIVCIGEGKQDKLLGKTEQVLRREILDIFKNLNREDLDNLIIAYEPVWAIGSGTMPSPKEIEKTIDFIKNLFYSAYKINVDVVYGGSINSKNIIDLENIPNCDGFLIGNSAGNIDELIKIISILSNS